MFCAVFFVLLGSVLSGPIYFDADLNHNVDLGSHQKDLADERLTNPAAVEAEIERQKAAYATTEIESPAPLAAPPLDNGSTIEDEDANKMNEKAGEEKDLLEGDIPLTNDQFSIIETSHKSNRFRRQAIKNEEFSWGTVNPVIPYSYSANYPKETRGPIIAAGMAFWEKHTCVRFKEVSYGYRVEIKDFDECEAIIGKGSGTETQHLSLGEGCMNMSTIYHELQHIFGFNHVQNRFDRDQYVDIDFDNIVPGHEREFNISGEEKTVLHDIPYEFGSIMHYNARAGAKDHSKPVINAKAAYKIYQQGMGGRLPTFYDIIAVNRHFNCSANCKTSVACANGGVQDVNNCNKCLCPLGWTGDKCDQRPFNTEIFAKSQLEIKKIEMHGGNKTDKYKVEYYLLKAPAGMNVQLTPIIRKGNWSQKCGLMGIEVKFLKDPRYAGIQVCEKGILQHTITSETNEMLVVAYSKGGLLGVELQYEAVQPFTSTANCKTSIDCANDGVQDVNNCNKCLCPLGWTGDKCDQRFINKLSYVAKINNTARMYIPPTSHYKVKYYLLQAPAGMMVEMKPEIRNSLPSDSCDLMGIEVKFLKDPRASGLKLCDMNVKHPTITSETNEMLVRAYTKGDLLDVEFKFEAVEWTR